MTTSKKVFQQAGRKGGKKTSPKKRKAVLANLVLANRQKRIEAKIQAIEHLMVENREAWLKTKDLEARKALDREFERFYTQKRNLEKS